jgi:hypothetical protein
LGRGEGIFVWTRRKHDGHIIGIVTMLSMDFARLQWPCSIPEYASTDSSPIRTPVQSEKSTSS